MRILKTIVFILFFMTGQVDAVRVMDFSFDDENPWMATVRVKKEGALESDAWEQITLRAGFEDLEDYDLESLSPPPLLNINNSSSCEGFKDRLASWVSQLKVSSSQFMFRGEYEGEQIEVCRALPSSYPHFPLKLEKISVELLPSEGQIRLKDFLGVIEGKVGGTEFKIGIDLKGWTPESFQTYEFPKSRVEEAQPNRVSIYLDGAAYEWQGRTVYYKIPPLRGIVDPKDIGEEIIWLDTSQSSSLHKKACAAKVWSAREREQHKAGIFVFPKESGADGSESFDEEAMSRHSFGSWSTRTLLPRSIEREGLYSLYTLMGVEVQVESPFIYSNGEETFLTKTYEQFCRKENPKEGETLDSFFLTYTSQTSFKIVAESSDPRLKTPTEFESGLYVLKGGNWCLLEENYNPKSRSAKYKAKKVESDILSQEAQALQRVTFPEMAEIYKHIGEMTAFIKTHPKTFEDDANFRRYHGLIYFQGLLKTMTSIPPEHEHLIVSLLLTVRENPDLNDPALWKPGVTAISDNTSQTECPAWLYSSVPYACKRFSEFFLIKEEFSFLVNLEVVIVNLSSLRCLPLLKTETLSLCRSFPPYCDSISWWKMKLDEQEAYFPPFSERDYKEIARFIRMNQLKKLTLSCASASKRDDITIQSVADAIRNQTSLVDFRIMGGCLNMKNAQYLLLNGVAHSSSIRYFEWDEVFERGDYIISIIGEMISKNKFITHAKFRFCDPSDLEAFNLLGKGLQNNTSLEKMELCIFTHIDRKFLRNHWPSFFEAASHLPFPLPGRSFGMSTTDLSEFKAGVQKSSLINVIFNFLRPGSHSSFPDSSLVIKVIKEIKKPGLKIKLVYPEGSQREDPNYPYDEWEG
ncbi:MAG TPA: hypothetical protein PLY23_01345 [Alphaproteobacteria bacterium]|nr:hypothetical protein [Alphaproteobacteria bacterium]